MVQLKTISPGTEFYEEISEFIDYIDEETTDLMNEVKLLKSEIESKDDKITDLKGELEYCESESFETIDCGIGTIEYRTDNLKLQILMEDFKEQQEKVLYQ